jgi:hypothetical protein
MRRVRNDEVVDLVTGKPYVGGLRVGLLTFTLPLVNLYVSEDRLSCNRGSDSRGCGARG